MENLCSSKSEEEVFETIVKLVATLAETKEDVQKIHKLTVEAGQSTR